MKYYLIVGEASGDLHASRLMQSLMQYDPEAEFRFFGGDLMAKVGGTRVKHYRELAYMGFVPVLLHLPTIFKNMKMCKEDIVRWKPDAVILVDYPGFNLSIAKFVKKNTNIPVYYYISPKIWAWKEWRIKAIKRDVKEMFSILPFEVPFYEKKHNYKIHYVGNPTAEEVDNFRHVYSEVALVTSGTATLETALLNVPQVVCYETPVPKLIRFAFKHIIKVRFISLVNLIADKEIVQELFADRFSIRNIANELYRILPGQVSRERMLADYQLVRDRLGSEVAPDNAARIMVEKLSGRQVYKQSSEPESFSQINLFISNYFHEHKDFFS